MSNPVLDVANIAKITSKCELHAWLSPDDTHGLQTQLRLGCNGTSGTDFTYLLFQDLATAAANGHPIPFRPVVAPIPPEPAAPGPNATIVQQANANNLFKNWLDRKKNSVENQTIIDKLDGYENSIKQSLLKGIDNCSFLKGYIINPINGLTIHQIYTNFLQGTVLAITSTDRNDMFATLSTPFYFDVNDVKTNALSQLTLSLFKDTEIITFIGTGNEAYTATEQSNSFVSKYGKNVHFLESIKTYRLATPTATRAQLTVVIRNVALHMDSDNSWRLIRSQYANKTTMFANNSSTLQPPLSDADDSTDEDSNFANAAVKKTQNSRQTKKQNGTQFTEAEMDAFVISAKKVPNQVCPLHANSATPHKAKDCKVLKKRSSELKKLFN